MITIKQLADQLGVSPTTVSNVIHGKTNEVSPFTIERVKQIIEKSNYIPNMTARNLARNKTHIIGIILCYEKGIGAQALADPFNGELIGSVASAIEEQQLYMMVHITNDENEAIQLALSWNVDGLIVCSSRKKEWSHISKETQKPVVFVDSYFDRQYHDYPNIGLDDRDGGYQITSYLIQHGHRKIAYSSDNLISVDNERFQGYQAALQQHGIRYQRDWYIPFLPLNHEKVFEEMLHRKEEFTAIFFASDYYASLAINYFQDHGLSIPDSLSVVGFDDNILGKTIRPALTTIHQDPSQKGRMAVSLLMNIMNGTPPQKCNIRLPVRLVERESVRTLEPDK